MDKEPAATVPSAFTNGFLITRQWQDTDAGMELVFWVVCELGPVRVTVSGQEAVCFIARRDLSAATRALGQAKGWRHAPVTLQNFDHQPVEALYFRSQGRLYEARDQLRDRGIPVHEADIIPPDRFLMERFITGGMVLEGATQENGGFISMTNPRMHPAEFRPTLGMVSVDIETAYDGSSLYSIGVYAQSSRLVFMVGEPGVRPGMDFLRCLATEAQVIEAFLDWIRQHDPDVLIGWNFVNFDLLFLQRVCDRVGVPFRLGRNDETVRWRRSRAGADRHHALIPGRVALDGIELMRNATYQFENFSLDHVARELLGRGKLVDDVDQRGAEIGRLFAMDKAALAEYNLEDCRLVWDIFTGEKLLDFAIERSRLTGLELSRYGGSVAAFDFLYLPRLHRAGYVAPVLGDPRVGGHSPGGYVMESEPGIYSHVIVLDFKSLYPSIIRTFHVDPLAMVEAASEDDPIEGFDGGRFSRNSFLLPGLIESLWEARDRAKATGNPVLSRAIKIIMNSFYGVLGTTGCRFFDPRLVSSITRRGHQVIKETKRFIEDAGLRVIYGDTDSVFVLVGEQSAAAVASTGADLARRLNTWWRDRLLDDPGVASFLEIEFETQFERFLMPTIRGSDAGSKKRYAGLVRTGPGEGDYRMVFKGLETVRSDWSPLARRFQQQLYEKIFLDQPYEAFVRQTVRDVLDGRCEPELLLRRRLRRRLDDYTKNIPPHVQAARKAEQCRRETGLPSLYEQGSWVEYYMTTGGAEPRQYRRSPIDHDFYIERQLAPIADSILVFKSTTMKELLDRQLGLF